MNANWVGMAPVLYLPRPFFENIVFSKMALNRQQKLKISIFFLHSWSRYYRVFQWYTVCFDTFSSSLEIEGNVRAVKFHSNRTVLPTDKLSYT